MGFNLQNVIKILTLLGIFVFGISAFAINGQTTYQAKIIKPDVLDPAATCVLYIEDYAAINMSGTGGLIVFTLGA